MDFDLRLPCKVVVCGDSISEGIVYSDEEKKYKKSPEGFVGLLQNSLNCAVTNISRFGNTIATALPKLNRNLEKEKPDIVLIELGGNDCDYKWDQIAADPKGPHFPATDLNTFQSNLCNLVKNLREKGIVPVFLTLPPIDADRYFRWISKNSEETGAKILEWLGSVTRIYWWQEMYNAAVLKVASSANTLWIDVRNAFLCTPDFRKYLCRDGIHPNLDGQKLISQTISEYLHHNYPVLLKAGT